MFYRHQLYHSSTTDGQCQKNFFSIQNASTRNDSEPLFSDNL